MALPENRTSQAGYCYLCDMIKNEEGKCLCNSVGISIKPLLAGSGNDSVLAREIWNAAIEAAAEVSEDYDDKYNIRKLKK